MSKIITEVKVGAIPFEKVFREINKKEYSNEIMIKQHSQVILFDKTEDLVRFAEFVHKYDK